MSVQVYLKTSHGRGLSWTNLHAAYRGSAAQRETQRGHFLFKRMIFACLLYLRLLKPDVITSDARLSVRLQNSVPNHLQ